MEHETSPARAFERMVAVYAVEGIAPICLGLQQDHAVDVPLFLLLAQADHAGLEATPEELAALVAFAADWRELAILPLRGLRVALRARCGEEGITPFRERIKELELEAERLHAAKLASRLAGCAGPGGGLAAAYLASLGVAPTRIAAATGAVMRALAALPGLAGYEYRS